jgi:hypothetical protein
VEYDEQKFIRISQTLGFKRRMRVGFLALLGRRAEDPETAWFVCRSVSIRSSPWLLVARSVLVILVLGTSALIFESPHSFAVRLGVACLFLVGLAHAVSLYTYRRALRVNEPFAQAPSGS